MLPHKFIISQFTESRSSMSSSGDPSYAHNALDATLDDVSSKLAPLLEGDSFESLQQKVVPSDSVNLNLSLAYSLTTIFYATLASQGVPPNDHPVMDDLVKIKSRIERFKKLKSVAEETKGRELTVDQKAALRMVSFQLARDSSLDITSEKRPKVLNDDNLVANNDSKDSRTNGVKRSKKASR
jgi:hypothetical protein